MNTPMNLAEAIEEVSRLEIASLEAENKKLREDYEHSKILYKSQADMYANEVLQNEQLRADLEVQEAHELSIKEQLEDAYKKLDYLQSIIDKQ